MAKVAIILAILGIAYWYWSRPHEESTPTLEADQLQNNAVAMQRCIKQEERMQAAGGVAGLGDVGSAGGDAEKVCAEKNNLYLRDGKWYSEPD
jgi:hypothetical protein